ncbi:MAG: hypothetical protein Q7K34_02355 [archaeon]|nr:hypothetical protein [archaeon]
MSLKAIGWFVAILLLLGVGYIYFSGTKLYDCKDGSPLTLSPGDCEKYWCSSSNKRQEPEEFCAPSVCPDGNEQINLFYCQKYNCADGSVSGSHSECLKITCGDGTKVEDAKDCKMYDCADGLTVDSPTKCKTYTCSDGTQTDSIKKCAEYCEAPSDCNPTNVPQSACFGEYTCNQNKCSWQCETGGIFTSSTLQNIAIPDSELINNGYSRTIATKEIQRPDENIFYNGFENNREQIVLVQILISSKLPSKQTDFANNFNQSINEAIKQGIQQVDADKIGEDSFIGKGSSAGMENLRQNLTKDSPKTTDYNYTYLLTFRKSNLVVDLFISTTSDQKAIKLLEQYGNEIASRIQIPTTPPTPPTPITTAIDPSCTTTSGILITNHQVTSANETLTLTLSNQSATILTNVNVTVSGTASGDNTIVANPDPTVIANLGTVAQTQPVVLDNATTDLNIASGDTYSLNVQFAYSDRDGFARTVTTTCNGTAS